MKEGVVKSLHPCFASWLDTQNADTMFMADQARDWSADHLQACHWYIEMDPNETPPHLVDLRRMVEPEFLRPAAVQPQGPGRTAGVEIAPGRASKNKGKAVISAPVKGSALAPIGREVGAKGNKRPATNPPVDNDAPKRGKLGDRENDHAETNEVASQSEARSSRSQSHTGRSFGAGQASLLRTSLINRAPQGVEFYEQVVNRSVADFLQYDSVIFEEFARKVRNVNFDHVVSAVNDALMELKLV